MDLFNNLLFGFGVALSLQNLAYCFLGVFVGTALPATRNTTGPSFPGLPALAQFAALLAGAWFLGDIVRRWVGSSTSMSTTSLPANVSLSTSGFRSRA